ncbi:uncharacterized protein DUF1206 [Actinomycetospora succinea]|uniref:Uncharacterized protein DUF1206 n=1 Tax=Actinomycetospora succinea TaxID=663603 RepID=A0A4R6USQ6_9PSEU|nr:DUF1206 domain-containing protein [Actinomycetospora succinea]TDQ46414.1 uncharacterized protein DUF1206 [Actinomycetospora succinea]
MTTTPVGARRGFDADWHDAPGHWSERLGRVGLAAYGVVHLLLAWVAVSIVVVGGTSPLDQRGAVAVVAHGGIVGRALLGLAAACLVVFAVWQVRAGAIGFRWVEGRGLRWRKRIGAFAKALGVGGVAYLAVCVIVVPRRDGSDLQVVAGEAFALPGGRVLVAVAAVIVLITAVSTAVTGIRATFLGDLVPEKLTPRVRLLARWLGAVGNLTRAVTFAVVGVLALDAVVDDAPDEVGGIDLALRTLADHTLGTTALAIAGVGFAAYGLYCLVDAYARHP